MVAYVWLHNKIEQRLGCSAPGHVTACLEKGKVPDVEFRVLNSP